MDRTQREARRRQEDMALNRGLLWVGGAIVLELLLLLIKRWYVSYQLNSYEIDRMLTLHEVLKFIRVAALAAAVLCLIWAGAALIKGKKLTVPVVIALVSGTVALCSHVTLAFRDADGVQMLLLLVPALAGLALVYYLYQKEFFLSAAAVGLSVVGLWFVRYGGMGLEAILCLAGLVLLLAAALCLKKKNGLLPGGLEIRALPKDASYLPIFISVLVGLAAVAAALVLGGTAAYYLIFVMAAWLFALLVYYTVKMM